LSERALENLKRRKDMLQVTKTSILTGKKTTMTLPITEDQLDLYNNTKINIQDVFPNLDSGQREFIKTGITQEEWEELIYNSSNDKEKD
tara:strand:+ start:167 stop:433 length:267 start_codon:yes stop_codon:yes gene_type:complete